MGQPFALTYTLSLALAGVASGRTILKRLRLQEPLTVPESAFFALPLGLGLLMLCILVLGVVGLLRPFLLAGLVVEVSCFCRPWTRSGQTFRLGVCRGLPLTWGPKRPPSSEWEPVLWSRSPPGASSLALVPAVGFLPTALVYHLAAPKQYLAVTGQCAFSA